MEKRTVENFLNQQLPQHLSELTAEQRPLWGKMTPQHMIEHLIVVFKMSLGRINIPVITKEEDWPRIRVYLMEDSPMRRNVGSPVGNDELVPLRSPDLQAAIDKLLAEKDKFLQLMEEHPDQVMNHPYGGPMTTKEWLFVHHKHIKHHLIQFELIPDYE